MVVSCQKVQVSPFSNFLATILAWTKNSPFSNLCFIATQSGLLDHDHCSPPIPPFLLHHNFKSFIKPFSYRKYKSGTGLPGTRRDRWMEGNYCCLVTVEGFRMWFKSNAPYVVKCHVNCTAVKAECKPCMT